MENLTGTTGTDETDAQSETETETTASAVSQTMTAIADLNIRQEPSTTATILGSVFKGTTVNVIEERLRWLVPYHL